MAQTKVTHNIANTQIALDAAEIPNLDAAKITSGTFADARISQSSVVAHSPQTDLQPVKSDISALALREATNESSAAFNLPNQFIDTFATDVLGTKTNTSITSGYVGTLSTSVTQFTSDSNTLLLLHGDGSDNGTTFTDSSSNNRTAIVSGVVTKTGEKKFGTASIYFGDGDGSSGSHGNSLSFADSSDWNFGANAWTVECWTKITTAPSNAGNTSFEYGGQAISDSSDEGGAYHFAVQNDRQFQHNTYNRGGNGNNTGNYQVLSGGSNTVSDNTWTHLAWTRDGNTVRLYKDGTQVNSGAISSDFSYKMVNNDLGGKWWISRRAYNTNYGYIRGYVDEYRISNNCRYPSGTAFTPNEVTTASATGTAIQNTNTVGSAKTKVGGTMLYKDLSGTATLGTDLKIYFTCNGGSNWTEATSYSAITPVYSTGIKQVRLGETTCTSGTDVRYKAVWANQASGSKETQLHGIGVNY